MTSRSRPTEELERSLEETALELRRISDRSRTIIEALPNGIIMVNQRGSITLCNAETERLFGYRREELEGVSIEILVPNRFQAKHPDFRNAFFASPQTRAMGAGRDLYGRRKDGSEFPIEIGLNPLSTDEGAFVLAAIVDITERKAAEERFRSVVESAPNALVIINDKGLMTLVNSQAEQMFGFDRADLIGQAIEKLVPPRYRPNHPKFRTDFFSSPAARPMGAGRDLYGLRRDNTEFSVEIGLKPLDIDGKRHVLAAVVDITERKQIEAKLHQANRELQQKNQEMEQFIYTVSHDLKAPLVTSMSFIQFIREDMPSGTAQCEEIQDSLARLERANRRMSQLIDDLLRLSRVGRLELKVERIDTTQLVKDTWLDLGERHKDIHVEMSIQEGMPMVTADRSRLVQLFENLLTNALKYGASANLKIWVGAKINSNGEKCFFVRDNGPGIAAEYHHKIFGLFERLVTDKEGTGVGLAIVSRVAQLHEGRVWVESSLGQGACFWLALPPPKGEVMT